eukprot:TRINITY_DN13119_c0_g1_i1.p1 TRINITY_DN13119_c0_g1~~TRINITY_DN13119_c0_g1_i1.p1  ORF type:complete len:245 (-),score=92.78 TRINITY_DN13119_c0_g1_i1:143-877(-)
MNTQIQTAKTVEPHRPVAIIHPSTEIISILHIDSKDSAEIKDVKDTKDSKDSKNAPTISPRLLELQAASQRRPLSPISQIDFSYVPPLNFALVEKGVYRSGYPTARNHSFLQKIGIKSIVYLVPDEYTADGRALIQRQGINLFQKGIKGNKEPFVEIPKEAIKEILSFILDKRNHPLLIHCNKGKHRTGCVVGCLRKMLRWSLASCFEEYRRFAGNKARILDQQFIELFSLEIPYDDEYRPEWI